MTTEEAKTGDEQSFSEYLKSDQCRNERRMESLAFRLQEIARKLHGGRYLTGNGGIGLDIKRDILQAIEETIER